MLLRKAPRDAASTLGPGPYRIQAVAELSGTPAATLRAWERRYGVPAPTRTSTAYRLYTAEDVAIVRRMSELITNGMAPSDAAKLLVGGAKEVPELIATDTRDPKELARQQLLAAVERWDGDAIDSELARISYFFDANSLFTGVLSPLLVEVGQRWERGDLSIAQEHLLSEKLELFLRAQLRLLDRREGPLVLATCLDREEHVLGLLGAALRFATSGWRVAVLGTATPAVALGEAVRSMEPVLVGLSVTRVPPNARAVFVEYASAIGTTPWVVGGRAAEDVRDAVLAAGGHLAATAGEMWSQQLRGWRRGP